MVGALATEGTGDMTAQKTGVQHLRDVLDGDARSAFEGSGCSDHVTRRNMYLTVAGAVVALLVLLATLIL